MGLDATSHGGGRPSRRLSMAAWCVLAVSIVLVWFSPFDHPLYPNDEGRYAAVAARMVDTGDWVVPFFKGQVHLTKPPLTYWLEGLAVMAFGRTEAAARLPAMIATTGVLGILFAFVARRRSLLDATVAVGLYGIMPLAIIVGRIGATDAILNLWWTLALVSAYLAVETDRLRWRLLLWGSVALAALTKGPLSIGPVGVTFLWLLAAGRLRDLRRLGFGWSPLAFVPVGLWIWAVSRAGHDVFRVWWMESAGRADGSLGKHEPWWFYLPIFLIGFFPATAMMTLPWFNMGPGRAVKALRSGTLESFLVFAVVVPLGVFSAAAGKLPTYILPLAAPLAILVSANVVGWLERRFDRPIEGFSPPDVRITVAVCCVLAAAAIPVAPLYATELFHDLWRQALVLCLPAIAAVVAAFLWREPSRRPILVTCVWAGFTAVWIWTFHVEDRFWEPRSQERVMRLVSERIDRKARVLVIGRFDQTRHFYYGGPIREMGRTPELAALRQEIGDADACIVDAELWTGLVNEAPELRDRLEPLATMPAFLGGEVMVMRVRREDGTVSGVVPVASHPTAWPNGVREP